MSLVNYGKDYEYASSRLKSTLVMSACGKDVYLVDSVGKEGGELVLRVRSLVNGMNRHVFWDEIDIAPPRLGYVNTKLAAHYHMRIPNRYYKQGIYNGCVKSPSKVMNTHNSSFVNMLLNKYSKIDECVENIVCGEKASEAFARDFAISNPYSHSVALSYRERKIGKLSWYKSPQNFNLELTKGCEYMLESFYEAVNEK